MPCEAKQRPRYSELGWECDGTDLVVVMDGPKFEGVRLPVVVPRSHLDEAMSEPHAVAFNPRPFEGGDHWHFVLTKGERIMVMGRGVVWIHEEALASLLNLRGDERVLGVFPSPGRLSVGVVIEGPNLPSYEPSCYPADLPLDGRVDLHLRAKLHVLLERFDRGKDGICRVDFPDILRRILDDGYDPREEMPVRRI